MCDFMAIILTILSQWWAIYKPDCGQQENRIKSESSARCPVVYVFRYGFLSFPIVYVSFDWIQIFNEFYKFPISRCVRRVVLECISYVTRIFPTHTQTHLNRCDDTAYGRIRWRWCTEYKTKTIIRRLRDRIDDSVNRLFTFFSFVRACNQLKTRSTWKRPGNKLY